MQWTEFFSALALVFVLEGMLPFVSPDAARRAYRMLSESNSGNLRIMGLVSILGGVALLYLVR